MSSPWFNDEQVAHMRYLDSVPPERRCWCGWHTLRERPPCPNCPPGKTLADRLLVACPHCQAYPPPDGSREIVHRRYCPTREHE